MNTRQKINYGAAFLAILFIFAFATPKAEAQILHFGAGPVYGFGIEKLGLQVNGNYVYNEKIRFGADFTYFFPRDLPLDVTANLVTLNLLGHYLLLNQEAFLVYGLGGLNIAFSNLDNVNIPGVESTDTDLGLNLGGGVEFFQSFGRIFAEFTFTIGGVDQGMLAAGVRFPVGGN